MASLQSITEEPANSLSATCSKDPKIFKRSRSVSFSASVNTREIEHRSDLDPQDIATMWYSREEFHAMKQSYYPIVKKIDKGISLDQDEEPRGLEIKTRKGNKERQSNKFVAIDAVLEEQDNQWESGRRDSDYLCTVYRQYSARCQMAAYLVGKADEKFVNDQIRDTKEGDHQQEEVELTMVRPPPSKHKTSMPVALLSEIKSECFSCAAA